MFTFPEGMLLEREGTVPGTSVQVALQGMATELQDSVSMLNRYPDKQALLKIGAAVLLILASAFENDNDDEDDD